MINDERYVQVGDKIYCKNHGVELSKVKIKDKFLDNAGKDNVEHYVCLECCQVSHDIRKVLGEYVGNEKVADDLFPIEKVLK